MENIDNNQQEETLQFRELLYRCLAKWYWFAFSLFICLSLGALYILRTAPSYHSSAEVQIKTDSKGRSIANDVVDFGNMGMFTSRTSVYNEMRAFQSPDIMGEVIDRLKLYMNYSVDGIFHPTTLYGTSLPMTAELLDVEDNASVEFVITPGKDSLFIVSGFVVKGEKVSKSVAGRFRDTLQTPAGRLVIAPNGTYHTRGYNKSVNVFKGSKRKTTSGYLSKLQVGMSDKNSDVITLGINDVSTQRAQDILSSLIGVYNEVWVQDKNQIANSTSIFINERLQVIEGELAGVDSDISAFKSENMIPNVEAAATMYMNQSTVINQQLQDLGNQLYMARYIKNYLTNEGARNQPLPAGMGINNSSIESRIVSYNEKLIQRNNLVANSGESNVLVKDMDQTLASMRSAISQSIDNEILALNTQYNNLQGAARQNTARIAANPNQAKQLLSVERQQSVKQSLYLYLLQKREENELSQAFTAYNTRIIKHPITSVLPVAPQKPRIMLLAFLLGLIIPFGIIYLVIVSDNKVRSRKDLKELSLPFAGEIPLDGKFRRFIGGFKKNDTMGNPIVVKEGSRNVINEAFRVMRTNIEFMIQDPEKNVISVTSYNPGSGKSFIVSNLAVCLAIKDKRVVVVDGDLRHGSQSKLAGNPEKGLSDYLAKKVTDINEVIYPSAEHKTLSVLPIGTVPPNPAELIASDRFVKLIEELKTRYDYVLIDCPPIDIVTDAKIINRCVDRTLFVVRAGLFEKGMLYELESLYKNAEYKNLCYILNGTTTGEGYYGRYGTYGRYGHYGYGNAYGSYYSNDK